MEMTVCYEAAVAHARSRPLPPPAFFTLPNISGPSMAEDLPRMAAGRSCEGRGSCHRRHQCCLVETCVAEWRENMWDAAVEQRRAHLHREIGHNRRSRLSTVSSSEAVDLYTGSGPVVYTHQTS